MFYEIAIADAYGQAFEFIKNPKESGLKVLATLEE